MKNYLSRLVFLPAQGAVRVVLPQAAKYTQPIHGCFTFIIKPHLLK